MRTRDLKADRGPLLWAERRAASRSAKVGAFPFLGGQFRKVSPLIAYSIRGELAEDLQRTPELTVQPAVV
jgi:hypothetical protein